MNKKSEATASLFFIYNIHYRYICYIMKILGFDVSSSCIGWCFLYVDSYKVIKKKKSGVIKPPKSKDKIENLAKTRDKIVSLIEEIDPDYIGIEDIIKFMPGKSSANTIIKLTEYNRMVSLASYDYLCESPKLFNVLSIRHGIKHDKKLPSKEDIPEIVAKHLKFKFKYKLNKNGNKKDENYDESDSIAVALYYAFILTGKIKVK